MTQQGSIKTIHITSSFSADNLRPQLSRKYWVLGYEFSNEGSHPHAAA